MHARRLTAPLLACAAALLLASCAVDASLSNMPTVYVDQWVNRAWQPEIYVQPQNAPMEPLTAVLVPLRLRTRYENSRIISTELTRVLWNVWLKNRVFPGLSLAREQIWHGPEAHLGQAAASGAGLLVGGEITHLLFGGSAGDTEVSLRIEVYDAATGALVWSMAHAGSLSAGMTKDAILFYKKNRLPSSPEAAIVAALAEDMSEPLKIWNFGQPKEDAEAPSPME